MNLKAVLARMLELRSEIETLAAIEQDLSDDERAQWGALNAEFDELDAQRVRLEEREARLNHVRNLALDPANRVPGTDPGLPQVQRSDDPFDLATLHWGMGAPELRSRAMSALDLVPHLPDRARERAAELVRTADAVDGRLARHIIVTGNEHYRSAFPKILAGPGGILELSEAERQAVAQVRALSLADAAGGYAVPFTLDPTIISTDAGSTNPFRMIATVRTTVTEAWNGLTSAGVSARWAAEGSEAQDNSPTLAQPSIPVHKADAFVPFSIEISMDWPQLEAELRGMFATARDDLEAAAFATGSGSGQPTGVVTALAGTASVVPPATAETFAAADLYAVEEALPARYRGATMPNMPTRASWAANKAIYNDIRQFGTTDGHALWERLGAGQPPQLLGYSAYEASEMDSGFNPAVTATNYLLVLGDFSAYYIVDRIGLRVELVPHLFHTANNRPSGQRGFYCYWRVGGDVTNIDAFRMLSIPTTA